MKVTNCRSCDAPVLWVETVNGKRMPIDESPVHDGLFTLDESHDPPIASFAQPGDTGERFTSHFATCPDAATFRRKKP